jgi:tetratricopeptide (TPR) repeat protein
VNRFREDKAALVRLAGQLARERAAARDIVDRISAVDVWDDEIPQAWRTAGVVQELLAAAGRILETDPVRSLSLSQLALVIATSIPPGTYEPTVQSHLEGSAWKEVATSHRYRSEYDAALRALDRADAHFGSSAALSHDQAVVGLARAVVFSEMGRYDDALTFLRETTPALRSFADARHLGHATLLRGMICYRLGQLPEARAAFEEVTKTVRDDLHTLAAAYNNLGQVHASLGNHQGAVIALQQARAVFEELAMPAEVTRTDWTLARALMEIGDWRRAMAIVHDAREDFLRRRMPEEAGLAALDLVECQLALGDQSSARSLTETVITEFLAAKLNARALTALAYLRDEMGESARARPIVRHVRSYLEQLKNEPGRIFLPLP